MSSATGHESQAAGKSPEKSNFFNTCNLLSNYLKHKGTLRDLSPNLAGQFAAKDPSSNRALDLFPQHTGEVSPSKIEATNEPKSAQMTIFYNGQVLVFNDFSSEKATEIMSFAASAAKNPPINHSEIKLMPIAPIKENVSGSSLVSDLPMTRTSSLYRFMERRKERVAARAAPYKVSGQGGFKASQLKENDDDQLQLSL